MAILASADPIMGFQTSAASARSYAAVAMRMMAARAIQTEPVRLQIAISSSASAPDCTGAWPMPPACGRLLNQGPTGTRIAQRIQ